MMGDGSFIIMRELILTSLHEDYVKAQKYAIPNAEAWLTERRKSWVIRNNTNSDNTINMTKRYTVFLIKTREHKYQKNGDSTKEDKYPRLMMFFMYI